MSSESQLHENITARGELEKEFHRLLSDGAEINSTAIQANIAARAQLEKDFHRHLVERVAEVIDSFRSTILNIVEMGQHDEALYLRVDALEVQRLDHEQRLMVLEGAHGIRPGGA